MTGPSQYESLEFEAWEEAKTHFYKVKAQYEELPPQSRLALIAVFAPLERRLKNGERTTELLRSIQSLE